jgi:hypothetical protein
MIKENSNIMSEAMSVFLNGIKDLNIKLQKEFKQLKEILGTNTGLNEMISNSLMRFTQDIHDKNLERDYQLKMIH